MWEVTATGTEGRTYVYEVDAPDYAPAAEVFGAACRQHSIERRDRNITETLDIRTGAYGVRLLYPQGQRKVRDSILERAERAELTLSAGDIEWRDGDPYIDGMEADDWLTTM